MRKLSQNRSQRGALNPSPADQDASIINLTNNLTALEGRLQTLQRAVHNLVQLRQLKATQASEEQIHRASEELNEIQKQADQLEVELLNQITSWQQITRPFWLAVRFGGLGLVAGWLLKGWVGG